MDNSTMTKARPKSKVKQENESIMKHIIKINEHMDYMMDALTSQADMLKDHQRLLERLRTRMGL